MRRRTSRAAKGGALLINDPRHIERAEILREKGTNRSLFFRGQVDRYSWVDVGSSYVVSDVLAAFLYGQLEQSERVQFLRRQIWEVLPAPPRGLGGRQQCPTPCRAATL